MQVSRPNEHGVLPEGRREEVARYGRAYCAINLAVCDDGLYRFGIEMMYSHGRFSTPIFSHAEGYLRADAARTAALNKLCQRWHEPFPSDPASVHEELRSMREQIKARLSQPLLL